MWMMKNSEGKKDASFSMMVIAFVVVMVKVVFGGTDLTMLSWTLSVAQPDAELAAVLLAVPSAGYVARKHTDKKFNTQVEVERVKSNEG